jgi:predicted ATP-dependent protease
MGKVLALGGIQQKIRAACDAGVKRLCVKVVSIRSERGLIKYAPFLLSALVKRSQTTLHTASKEILLPADNLKEAQELSSYILDTIKLTPVQTVDEVLRHALVDVASK